MRGKTKLLGIFLQVCFVYPASADGYLAEKFQLNNEVLREVKLNSRNAKACLVAEGVLFSEVEARKLFGSPNAKISKERYDDQSEGSWTLVELIEGSQITYTSVPQNLVNWLPFGDPEENSVSMREYSRPICVDSIVIEKSTKNADNFYFMVTKLKEGTVR